MEATTHDPALVPHGSTSELQEVIDRFVESRNGYREAAAVIDDPGLKSAFNSIADSRETLSGGLVGLAGTRDRDSVMGSHRHRWWLKLRAGATQEVHQAALVECLQREKELKNALLTAMINPAVKVERLGVLQPALDQVIDTVAELEVAVGEP